MQDVDLLQEYRDAGSEMAFEQLVARHANLVYSTAFRRLGDPQLAEDAAQQVFCLLARKANQVSRSTSMVGWLHRAANFVALTMLRSENRRRKREEEAGQMHANTTESDGLWSQIVPILDDALEELSEKDRVAILLRFFEGKVFAEVGVALGTSEDTARMRVDRALEKLRGLLVKRGVAITSVALVAFISQEAVQAAPTGLVTRVKLRLAAGAGTASIPVLSLFQSLRLFPAQTLKVASVAVGFVTLLTVGIYGFPQRSTPQPTPRTGPTLGSVSSPTGHVKEPILLRKRTVASPATNATLVLHIVEEDGGRPIPDVGIRYSTSDGRKSVPPQIVKSTKLGVVELPFLRTPTVRLGLLSQVDGYAENRLVWDGARGEVIPDSYTLRLGRATPIGGFVVDADGKPVAGAEVGFGNDSERALEARPQSDNSGELYVATVADSKGQWRINRFAQHTLRTVQGSARDPEYAGEGYLSVKEEPGVLKQLLAGTYVFRLGTHLTMVEVQGIVTDPGGQPVAGAHVLLGELYEINSRETTTKTDGSFFVKGRADLGYLTASARGFAPTTIRVDLTNNPSPFHLTLQKPKAARLRVIDNWGSAVPDATITFDSIVRKERSHFPVQVQVEGMTDREGRFEWREAPDQELSFAISTPDHIQAKVKVRRDGKEHVVTMLSPLRISGTVYDANTGQPIPKFRLITGWSYVDDIRGGMTENWSPLDRFQLSFEDGTFEHVYKEPAINATPNPSFLFKFEAEGYDPQVSRAVALEEGDVRFDVALSRTTQTKHQPSAPGNSPTPSAE